MLVDHRGQDTARAIPPETLARLLQSGNAFALLDQPVFRENLLPDLLDKAGALAQELVPGCIAQARQEMTTQLDHEIERLRQLQKVNRSVRPEEVALLVAQRNALEQHLAGARLRLEALRVIRRGGG